MVPEERRRLRLELRREMLEVSVVYVCILVLVWFLIQLSEDMVNWKHVVNLRRAPLPV